MNKKPQVPVLMSLSFWCGAMAHAGFVIAFQDWLGLESYIQYSREHWVALPWTVGAGITLVAIIIYYHRRSWVVSVLEEVDDELDRQG